VFDHHPVDPTNLLALGDPEVMSDTHALEPIDLLALDGSKVALGDTESMVIVTMAPNGATTMPGSVSEQQFGEKIEPKQLTNWVPFLLCF